MNTSDRQMPAREAFTLDSMSIGEEALAEIRLALYHSRGPGYYVFPAFVDANSVAHMRRLWSTVDPAATHAPFQGKHQIYPSCPDYFTLDAAGNRTFYNFFWNSPLDELTYTASFYIQILRNRISGRVPFNELLPQPGKAASYRFIISRSAKTWIAPHRDYFDHDRRFEKNRYDLSRLQATLFLADKGQDYSGTGFRLERNDGRTVCFGTDVPIRSGDLVLWRYNNQHSVEEISTQPGQAGFVRMIFPFETVNPAAPVAGWPDRIGAVARRGRRWAGRLLGRRA